MEEVPEYMKKGALGCQRVHHSIIQYWSRLGSSKPRISGQREQGKELILVMMMEAPEGILNKIS